MQQISIIIPAKNESAGLTQLLPALTAGYPKAQIIVVDDGSTDETATVAAAHGVLVISHPYSQGNGAAIKTGVRAAIGDILVFMDADGQHCAEDVQVLLDKLETGFDMVVGARTRAQQANFWRAMGNRVYNGLASYMVNQRIADLTSGFRVAKAKAFKQFLHLLPNGFSYPSTSTLAFFRTGYSVAYVPVNVQPRIGQSHLRPFRDGIRFFLILYKIATLYSPLKIFMPFALIHLIIGCSYYAYTFVTLGRFTNMSAVFLTTAVIIFLIGLVSEQITMLLYQPSKDHET